MGNIWSSRFDDSRNFLKGQSEKQIATKLSHILSDPHLPHEKRDAKVFEYFSALGDERAHLPCVQLGDKTVKVPDSWMHFGRSIVAASKVLDRLMRDDDKEDGAKGGGASEEEEEEDEREASEYEEDDDDDILDEMQVYVRFLTDEMHAVLTLIAIRNDFPETRRLKADAAFAPPVSSNPSHVLLTYQEKKLNNVIDKMKEGKARLNKRYDRTYPPLYV